MNYKIIILGLTILVLVGCENTPIRQDEVAGDIQEALEQGLTGPDSAEPPSPPAAVVQSLLPPVQVVLPRQVSAPEPRFDISVVDAAAPEFFMSLVADTPHNMVVHPAVQGTISLTMKNVSIEEVMETVRRVYGYEYQTVGNGYQVLPARLQPRVFHVNYLNIKRSGASQTRVSSGQITQSTASNGSGTSDDTEDAATSSSGEGVSGSRVQTLTKSDFWSELKGSITALIAGSTGGSVVVSPQSGLMVVRALPDDLRTVEEFLRVMQTNLNRQVILEAKILEVELNDGYQTGINWAALSDLGSNKSLLIGQTGGGSLFTSGSSEIAGNTGTLDPDNLSQVVGTDTSAFGGVFSIAMQLSNFTTFIELLESQGNVQVLSSPRVSTVNNQKAVIKVGIDEFFVTDISSTTVTGTSTTTTPDITLTPFFSGIALDVTPHIDEQNNVILHIHPSVSRVEDQTKLITVAGQPQSVPLALSSVRESDSVVRAHSGQIVVIGGLMTTSSRDARASVPVLGDMPVVGGMFRHDRQVAQKSELVILLRPLVVNDGGGWAGSIRDTLDNVRDLQGELRSRSGTGDSVRD
ncbi:MAG: pilus (MSHA type) biogenesis protein MshL [Gammaproteobacteria bacterium]|nr:pilus (MSHA type) biogenesis protein MshL [Gammaproteobacteria bacterium]